MEDLYLPAATKPKGADATPTVTTTFYGFDRSTYPGDSVMQDWWTNTVLYWTGLYLAPAPHHANMSWMTKRSTLKAMGWGFGLLYVGRQAGDGGLLTDAQGRSDAQNASALAQQAGFSPATNIFLDIETGGLLSSAFHAYIKGWTQEMFNHTPFVASIYCSYSQTPGQIKTAVAPIIPPFWCWRLGCPPSPGCTLIMPAPAPSGCGVSYASAWQFAQSGLPGSCPGFSSTGNCNLKSGASSYPVDLDTANSRDPSNGRA